VLYKSVIIIIIIIIIIITNKKHHTFWSTAGARPTIPTIVGMVIEEVRTIFEPPKFFDPTSNFTARGIENL